MSSPRSSSPAREAGSPGLLTPRSKIRALLAAVDSSEDEGSPSKTQGRSKRPSLPLPATTTTETRESQSSEDDESDVEVRPRGRLAARMHAAARPAQETAPTETITQPDEVPATTETTSTQLESDEDDLPVAPRRLKRKAPQPDTKTNETPARSPSPGLFVSSPIRPSPTKTADHQSESEDELPALRSDRFKALVEKKKQQILAKQAAEEARKAEQREKLSSEMEQFISDDDNVSDINDDEGGRKLTQEARPTRKASKKAIEEMNRESQRLARSMQLAHEAKTRKKISKSSLFERFNFRPAGEPTAPAMSSSRPATPVSDVEMKDPETPPSSPPVTEKDQSAKMGEANTMVIDQDTNEELPSLGELASSSPARLDKGKGKEIALVAASTKPRRQVRVRLPQPTVNLVTIDSDDELEITNTAKGRLDAVFDNVPAKKSKECQSMHALRALAQLKSPARKVGNKRDQPGMSVGELQSFLQQKARQQAKLERENRLQMLKAQGVVVQSAEERERQMQEVEDIVAKARQEAEEIMAQEKAEAKQNEDGTHDPLAWDDSEDEEYQASADEDGEAQDVELSGSEEEQDEDGEETEEAGNGMFDDVAEDASDVSAEDAGEAAEDTDMDDDEIVAPKATRRARKQTAILSDDEAEVQATPRPKSQATPKVSSMTTPGAPGSVLRSAKKTFIPGLPVQGPAGLGLTQIFAGTMDDSQMTPASGPTQSMMPDFDHFPDSFMPATVDPRENSVIPASQTQDETQATTQGVQLNVSQSQMRSLDSLLRDVPDTQMSEMIEPSQDGGIVDRTPLKQRFIDAPESTVDTVVLDGHDAPHDSPLVRRGRLRRRLVSEIPGEEPTQSTVVPSSNPTAFNILKDGALKEKKDRLLEDFNRKKSKAKEMVEEQAEESEDEYQGLGGYDGEDSDNESIASVKEMIDDAAGNDMDERKLAAFYADRERANDEQQVQKLFKDITSGMLRRKRGADYDLSDSDDGGEARRRRKRQQFAKMQKALYADERVKKIAENPGNQAFLRTIEDHGSDDELDILAPEEPVREDSQSQSEQDDTRQQVVPDSQPPAALGTASENRAPAHLRRTKAGRKPANLGEVRETLSNLLDDGREMSIIPATEVGSDSEEDEPTASIRSDKENDAPNPRRSRQAVVDRITLKRNSSTSSTGTNSRLAFAAQAQSSTFKVPALLRRATTNSLMSGSSSGSSTGVSTPTTTGSGGGFGDDAKIKKAAGKRSGINAFARENERRAKLAESERRRQEKKVKGAERRIGVVGGLLGKGSFE